MVKRTDVRVAEIAEETSPYLSPRLFLRYILSLGLRELVDPHWRSGISQMSSSLGLNRRMYWPDQLTPTLALNRRVDGASMARGTQLLGHKVRGLPGSLPAHRSTIDISPGTRTLSATWRSNSVVPEGVPEDVWALVAISSCFLLPLSTAANDSTIEGRAFRNRWRYGPSVLLLDLSFSFSG